MAFFEICQGSFAKNIQALFEEAQEVAHRRGKECTVTAQIKIKPPTKDGEGFGNISFSANISQPKRQSMEFPVKFDDGRIISEGESIESMLQLDLFAENTVGFPKEGVYGE